MEPNERHPLPHHHQHQHQHQDHHHLTSPYYNPYHHHTATTNSANNGSFPQQQPHNDGSPQSLSVYPHSVPSSAVTVPIDPVKRKRGRPRKYDTPAQALAAKKLASSASNSSARERREQAAAVAGGGGGGALPLSKSGSRKSILSSVGKTGQSFIPHIINITPGEDVAQKIILFAEQSKHELCILSASGIISNASLSHMASGTTASYEGHYEILSLSGSYIRGEHGGKTGGLSICLSSSDGHIFGGGVGGQLMAAGPVQVIIGTFRLDRKKEGRNSVKGEDDASGSGGNMLPSPPGFHSGMESSERNPNDEHHQQTSTSSAMGGGGGRGGGGGGHYMMQPPQGMHMTHARPSEWGSGGGGYDFSGPMRGNGSSENGDYE